MPAVMRFIGWLAVQLGIEKPEEAIKFVLLIFFLPMAVIAIFFVLPCFTAYSVPLILPSQVQFYVDAAESVNEEYSLDIDWEELLAFDTVLLEQDFSRTSAGRALALANDFVEEIEKEDCTVDEDGNWDCSTYYVYEQRSLEEVMYMKGLNQDQKEWVYYLLEMGLSQYKDVGCDMPEGWEPDFSGTFTWPLPGSYKITSKFGPRVCPVEGIDGFHSGLDIGAPRGTPVVAAEAGVVIRASSMGSAGRTVIIKHGDGYETRYYHLHSIRVRIGQEVERGEVIGGVGSTGRSTGPHLHFEIRRFTKAIDPLEFF